MTVTTPSRTPLVDAPKSSGTRLVDRVFRSRALVRPPPGQARMPNLAW